MRPLPDFMIAGVAKCGTTTLADWLREHPDVFVPDAKELHFFSEDANWEQGLDWYRGWFADAGDARLLGEATPYTCYFPDAVERLHETAPDARLVVIVRDPVARAYSNWCHVYYRMVLEDRPFPQLVDDELREGPRLPSAGTGAALDRTRHLTAGLYLDQIELLLERFPREQVHVVVMEDMRTDAAGVLAGVCRFLGVDPVEPPDGGRPSNVHFEFRPVRLWRFLVRHRILTRLGPLGRFIALKVMRREGVKPPPIDAASRERLAEFYAEPNARLAEWLGRDLPWARPAG